MRISINAKDFLNNIVAHEDKFKIAVSTYAESVAKKLEEEAKQNAPWVDRTGLARKTITGDVTHEANKAVVNLKGNMDYSIFLEEARGGRNAVIKPTLDNNEENILRGLQRLIR